MAEWLKEYWYLLIVLVAATVVAAVIFYFAAKAYSKRRAFYKREEENIKRLLDLKEKFRVLTEEAIMSADEDELLEGVALSYQLRLQKEEKIEECFSQLNDDVKDIYALDVFVQDKTSKEFFSQNGEILKDRILGALIKIGMSEFADKLRPIYCMYDKNNEEVSYSEKVIDKFDEEELDSSVLAEIKVNSAKYIKENCKSFEN